jgi:hypothetical protein
MRRPATIRPAATISDIAARTIVAAHAASFGAHYPTTNELAAISLSGELAYVDGTLYAYVTIAHGYVRVRAVNNAKHHATRHTFGAFVASYFVSACGAVYSAPSYELVFQL